MDNNFISEDDKITLHALEISGLIARHISGDITAEENDRLLAWRKKSEDNERLFLQFQDNESLKLREKAMAAIHVEKAWATVNSRLEKKVFLRFVKSFRKYAAIFIALIIAGSSVFYFLNYRKSGPEPVAPVVEIQPGSNKAILFTADGNTIDLEKDTVISSSGLRMQNSGNTLSYMPDRNRLSGDETGSSILNRLVTPRGGEYEIILPDGTHVWLNADSELKYPTSFQGSERIVYLNGEAYFDVKKNSSQPFVVKTRDMHIRVLGTAFNVMDYGDNEITHTTLVNGKVDVDIVKEDAVIDRIQLLPNMQAAYHKGNTKGTSAYVDVNKYIAWKNGFFLFENERMEEMLRKVARWYDVEFTFENEAIKEIRYSGDMKRFGSFESMLNLLRQDSDIELIVKGKTIHIRYKDR